MSRRNLRQWRQVAISAMPREVLEDIFQAREGYTPFEMDTGDLRARVLFHWDTAIKDKIIMQLIINT